MKRWPKIETECPRVWTSGRPALRAGFTLIEVAFAIGILVVGLTGSLSVFLVGIRWCNEIRITHTAFETAQSVIDDPVALARDPSGTVTVANPVPLDPEVKGWLAGYYCVRQVDPATITAFANGAGSSAEVRCRLYSGGDETSGKMICDLVAYRWFPQ